MQIDSTSVNLSFDQQDDATSDSVEVEDNEVLHDSTVRSLRVTLDKGVAEVKGRIRADTTPGIYQLIAKVQINMFLYTVNLTTNNVFIEGREY